MNKREAKRKVTQLLANVLLEGGDMQTLVEETPNERDQDRLVDARNELVDELLSRSGSTARRRFGKKY